VKYYAGIDTGGTYTDAVLLDMETGAVRARAKRPTTHHDLSLGVGEALEALFSGDVSAEAVQGLAVSTTLATNAVVENRGARVGLFVIGIVRHFKLPVVANVFLKGGHDIQGREEQPLDLEGLVDTVHGLKNEVDSYAVCAAMSIKNPAHELVAEEAIRMIDPKPVYCSHRVSSHPGMKARAATACLHARLQPLMTDFLASVQRSMLRIGMKGPVVIIRGDGRGANLEEVAERAALTMASGPAATAVFGSRAGLADALVVDVGGTTTDVCMLQNGQPLLNSEGCRIGEWQTHVEAIAMSTGPGGGDSHLFCDRNGGLRLLPTRVRPLAMSVGLPGPETWLGRDRQCSLVTAAPGVDAVGDPILENLERHGPLSPAQLAERTSLSALLLEKRLEALVYRQKISVSGFTPTDALHVLGRLDIGDPEPSRRAAAILARAAGLGVRELCERVVVLTEKAVEAVILDHLIRQVWGEDQVAPLLNRRSNSLFDLNFSLKIPLIGIGAAARVFLPRVAQDLGTTVTFPEFFETGNAIGAALIGSRYLEQPG